MLRLAGLLLINLALFGTDLRLNSVQTLLPRIALVVDDSRSMQTVDRGIGRDRTVRRLLRSPEIESLRSRADVRLALLSEEGEERPWGDPDSLRFEGEATDIAGILGALAVSEGGWDAVLLLSDGAYNRGDDPMRRSSHLDFPVYCSAIGSQKPPSDVVVTEMITNDIAFVGHRVPVDLTLRGTGFGGRRVGVRLRTEEEILDEGSVTLQEGGRESSVRLHFQPEQEGLLLLMVEVDRLEGEATFENNIGEVVVRVRQSRFQVLLAAGAPHPDLAFVRRLLAKDENLDLTVRTQRQGGYYEGSFPSDAELRDTDLFLLMDLPSRRTAMEDWTRLADHLNAGNKPLLLFAGKGLDPEKLNRIGARIPVGFPGRLDERYVHPRLTPEGRLHPALRVREDPEENRAAWERLPPLFVPAVDGMVSGTRVLAWGVPGDAPSSDRVPLIAAHEAGEAKTLLFSGYGLFRWDLLMWGVGESNEVLRTFLENAVRWLATREDEAPVRLSLNRALYGPGEDILVSAYVYDETYQPLSGALVSLRIEGPAGPVVHSLSDAGGGRYRASLRLLEGGKYTARIGASLRGRSLGSAEDEFWVSSFSPELLDTRAHPELLAGISEMTGGKAGPPDSLSSIVGAMAFSPRSERVSHEVVLNRWTWLLAAVLLLFSTEWFIRKRRGMV